jgi:hypothetical protein
MKIEIKKSMYCYVEFYSIYIDGALFKNYNTLKQAENKINQLIKKTKK